MKPGKFILLLFFACSAILISVSVSVKYGKENGWVVTRRACRKTHVDHKACGYYKRLGYCEPSSTYYVWMYDKCRIECKVCPAPSKDDCNCNKNEDCFQRTFNWYTKPKKLQSSSKFECQCQKGWAGVKCDKEDIDECVKPNSCDRRTATCLRKYKGSYGCVCKPGFQQEKDKVNCIDINECAKPYPNPCTGTNETCINTFGSFTCECDKGLVRKYGKCVKKNINECPPNQYMDKTKKCRCRKTIARYDDGDICYDCNKNGIGVSEHSKIPDYCFTATSVYSKRYGAFRARGQSPTSWAMSSKHVDKKTGNVKGNQFLEIDLLTDHFICAIATAAGRFNEKEFVKTYKISYQKNGKWTEDSKIYEGPTIGTANGFKKVILTERPRMRRIRIHPKTCNIKNDCAMRLELYGHRVDPNGQCTMNSDKESFDCKCNKGFIGDGSTCRMKMPFKIIGRAGFNTYKTGQVLNLRRKIVSFLPDGAKKPVYGYRYYDYAIDVIPDRERVELNSGMVLFRKNASSSEFHRGIITKVLGKDTYMVILELSFYNYEKKQTEYSYPPRTNFTVKLRDIRVLEPHPRVCNSIKNSIYVSGEYPGAYSCLCPYAGEQPSDGKCRGDNKFYVSHGENKYSGGIEFFESSIKYIDAHGYAWTTSKELKKVFTDSEKIFNYMQETVNSRFVAYGDSILCDLENNKWVIGIIRAIHYDKVQVTYNMYGNEFNDVEKQRYTNGPQTCMKIANCPINSTCVIRGESIPSTYSCECNGPVIDNICTKPIEIMAFKRGNSTNVFVSNAKTVADGKPFLESTDDGFISTDRDFYRSSVLEHLPSTTALYDEAPYWLLNTDAGKTTYTLGSLGGRVFGEKESVVFVEKQWNAIKKSNMSIVKMEKLYKEIEDIGRNSFWSCREENQCGKPGEGICVSGRVWNNHHCVCAEGFRNFWGPKGETCVPMDYN